MKKETFILSFLFVAILGVTFIFFPPRKINAQINNRDVSVQLEDGGIVVNRIKVGNCWYVVVVAYRTYKNDGYKSGVSIVHAEDCDNPIHKK